VGSLTFLGLFAMFSLPPRYQYASPRALLVQAPKRRHAAARRKARRSVGLLATVPKKHPIG